MLAEQLGRRIGELLDIVAINSEHKRLTVREVTVQRAGTHTRQLRYRVERGVAGGGKCLVRGFQDAIPVLLRVRPQRLTLLLCHQPSDNTVRQRLESLRRSHDQHPTVSDLRCELEMSPVTSLLTGELSDNT